MAEQVEKKQREQRPIDILRERQGGMSKELQESFKLQNKLRKSLREALKTEARTVPELAQLLQLPAPEVMWHVMALKKYGAVVEAGERGEYVTYTLKEGE